MSGKQEDPDCSDRVSDDLYNKLLMPLLSRGGTPGQIQVKNSILKLRGMNK